MTERNGGPESTELTGGECVHRALVKLGVSHVFGIPSVHNLPIFDAIARHGQIEPIIVRSEQAAAHAADGYARATGRLGVVLASTGPGTTNTVTGIYEAAFASSPVLVVTGQTDSVHYGKGRGAGHEAEQQVQMLQSVARRVESPRYTHDIAPAIFRAAADILTGRPQPGVVEIPIDIQYGTTVVPVAEPLPVHRTPPKPDAVREAQSVLTDSERRVIIAGGGVLTAGAEAELRSLAERLEAPVFTTVNGRGAISDVHPLAMGAIFEARSLQSLIDEADVVLAVGTRFRGNPRLSSTRWRAKLVHVDVDPRVIGLVQPASVAVVADARLALAAIGSGLNARAGAPDFVARMRAACDRVLGGMRERIGPDHAAIMDAMRAALRFDGVLVRDMTIPAYYWANQLFPIHAPRTTMNPTSGAIGPGLPLAIGAAVGTRRKVIVVHGDGGLMVHIGELATAVQYRLPLVICVFTDGGYGVLRNIQRNQFDGRTIGVDLATPDFVMVAQGMGARAERARSASEFGTALARAMLDPGPVLIDVDQCALAPIAVT